jgi:hypothetical protein
MLLGVTSYTIRYTVSNEEKMHVAVVGIASYTVRYAISTLEDTLCNAVSAETW